MLALDRRLGLLGQDGIGGGDWLWWCAWSKSKMQNTAKKKLRVFFYPSHYNSASLEKCHYNSDIRNSPGHKKPRTEDRTEKTKKPKPNRTETENFGSSSKYSVRFQFFTRLNEEPNLLNI